MDTKYIVLRDKNLSIISQYDFKFLKSIYLKLYNVVLFYITLIKWYS